MTSPTLGYIGEIRMFAGNFAPADWAFCNGQAMAIAEYETLFALIGTTYGGDGQSTFNLPDLRSRAPMHQGNGFVLAQMDGTEQVTLGVQQMPTHTHALVATTSPGSSASPSGAVLAQTTGGMQLYYEGQATEPMGNAAILPVGGGQPHDNLQSYLCLNFIISLSGIFPSPS
ncbi:phage tail protein [Deinococcus altitudinis]|uniref:phage tail protein n=1 Tax=Deinococcus altitudinis TaxID=468914 RepID=UPI003892975E